MIPELMGSSKVAGRTLFEGKTSDEIFSYMFTNKGVMGKVVQKVIGSVVLAAIIGSIGFVSKEWTSWTSSTLIDLNTRTAVMEAEIRNTNAMVSLNNDMLKYLVSNSRKANLNDKPWSDVVSNLTISGEEG